MREMAKPFERFESDLNWQQVSLLLDTVLYFEDAPKLLLIPDLQQTRVPVPLVADTLRAIADTLSESEPHAAKRFAFEWEEGGEADVLIVRLPNGETVRQPTDYQAFSPV
ncbi:hypothetical protein [Brevibacillus sp. H7]|uniref:hypothetical protein n=1 Tax=Brevibacillus sp. H7 TaxID=3349138 RepID=UPI0038018874